METSAVNYGALLASSILSFISLNMEYRNTFVDPFVRQCFTMKFFSPVGLFSRPLFSLYDRAVYRQGCCLLFLILSLTLHNVMKVHLSVLRIAFLRDYV